MKLTTMLAIVAALVAAVSAAAAGPINGTDRANAARACAALKAANGSAFSQQYATFGACTSQWAKKAHADRVAAQAACRAKDLTGKRYADCVKAATRTSLAAQTTDAKNAAKACAAERKSLGDAEFGKKYGSTTNLRNAFGKCVSQHASSKSNGGTKAAQHYAVSLAALNASGVAGSGTLLLNGNKLTAKLRLTGLERGQSHAVAIRGLSSGTASCPAASADSNADGMISLAEGQPSFGDVLLSLDQAAQAGSTQTVLSSLLPLEKRAIVVLGKTVNGTYDPTLPVACGVITAK